MPSRSASDARPISASPFVTTYFPGAQRTKLTGGPLSGRSPACGTSALGDGLARTLAKVERRAARKERPSFYDNFLDYLCCARSVMNDSNAFAGNDHDDIEVLPRSCFRVGRSVTPERPCGLGFAVRPLFSELVGSDPEGEFLRPRHST